MKTTFWFLFAFVIGVAPACGRDGGSSSAPSISEQSVLIVANALTVCTETGPAPLNVEIDGDRDFRSSSIVATDVLDPGFSREVVLGLDDASCPSSVDRRTVIFDAGDRHLIVARGQGDVGEVTIQNLRGVIAGTRDQLIIVHGSARFDSATWTAGSGSGTLARGEITVAEINGSGATDVTFTNTAGGETATAASEWPFGDDGRDMEIRLCVLRDSAGGTTTEVACGQTGFQCGSEACRSRSFGE